MPLIILFQEFKQNFHLFNQVAGAAIIYEVHRNSRAEARKEEHRKQEIEVKKSQFLNQ